MIRKEGTVTDNINIAELTSQSILEPEIFAILLDTADPVKQVTLEEALCNRAKELRVLGTFKKYLVAYRKKLDELNQSSESMTYLDLEYTDKGKLKSSIGNYVKILEQDEAFKGKILFNEMSGYPEKVVDGKTESWIDLDDSKVRNYIETHYGICNKDKINDALAIVSNKHSYNPLKDKIEAVKWDGISRIETMLIKWLKAEDTPYAREVSRLIFAGGINRLYNPGCKFDIMVVLVGEQQGEGKSTFVSWLALNEEYFTVIKEIEGQRGIEALEGAWICEMAELLALTKAKEVEAVKAYITQTTDKGRKAFGKHVVKDKRQCIFIGTSNKAQFLTDKTGNRRFFPILCYSRGWDLYQHEAEVKYDILQAWAEAYYLYKQGKLPAVENPKLKNEIKQAQELATEEDPRVGIIAQYLEDKTETCNLDVWYNALKLNVAPSHKDHCEIGLILKHIPGWRQGNGKKNFERFGRQRYYYSIDAQPVQNEKGEIEYLPF